MRQHNLLESISIQTCRAGLSQGNTQHNRVLWYCGSMLHKSSCTASSEHHPCPHILGLLAPPKTSCKELSRKDQTDLNHISYSVIHVLSLHTNMHTVWLLLYQLKHLNVQINTHFILRTKSKTFHPTAVTTKLFLLGETGATVR